MKGNKSVLILLSILYAIILILYIGRGIITGNFGTLNQSSTKTITSLGGLLIALIIGWVYYSKK